MKRNVPTGDTFVAVGTACAFGGSSMRSYTFVMLLKKVLSSSRRRYGGGSVRWYGGSGWELGFGFGVCEVQLINFMPPVLSLWIMTLGCWSKSAVLIEFKVRGHGEDGIGQCS